MHKFHFYFFYFFIFLLLSSCGGGSGGTPNPSDLSGSPSENSFVFYLEPKLHLIGKFQLLSSDGEKNIYETSLPVQWTPRDPDRPDLGKEPQVFPKEGFTLSNLAKGEYLFRVIISHQGSEGETVIGSIETKQSVSGGKNSPLDFSKSSWVYPDDDGDGFSNIAELTDGDYDEESLNSPSLLSELSPLWVYWKFSKDLKDPKDANSHPADRFLITPEKINPTSPNDQKISKLIGEILSVQAGTNFTVIHFSSDGTTVKEKINFFSKIDGSFEVQLTHSEEEDKVILVVTSKMNGDQIPKIPSPPEGEDQGKGGTLIGKWMKITYRPLKMIRCRAVKGVDPIPGSGYVLLEGEGISANPVENEVSFPKEGGGEVLAEVGAISWEGSRSRELKVKIPFGAVSGYPKISVMAPKLSSAECPTQQPVVVSQFVAGERLPDFFIPRVEVPHVALMGQTISIDIPILNQGLKGVDPNSPFYYSTRFYRDEGDEIEIVPNPISEVKDLLIYSGLDAGAFILPSQRRYFLFSGFADPNNEAVRFKAIVNPSNSIKEKDKNNNSRVADHDTSIHYVDLKISLLPGKDKSGKDAKGIDINGTFFPLIRPGTYWEPLYKNEPIVLPRDSRLTIKLANLKNNGTFPMIRKSGMGKDANYLPVQDYDQAAKDPKYANDPLNTLGNLYQGKENLKKSSLVKLIEEANLLNQKTELPVLVHVYYAKRGFRQSEEKLIQCSESNDEQCELCINRLERTGEAGEIKLSIPVDKEKIPEPGYLIIAAEAVQIDPRKINKDGINFDYCRATIEERKKMHLILPEDERDQNVVPLLSNYLSENIIIDIPVSPKPE